MKRGKLNCACAESHDQLSAKPRRGSWCPLVENRVKRGSLFRGDPIKIKNQTVWASPTRHYRFLLGACA
jgi:hypothetical protein